MKGSLDNNGSRDRELARFIITERRKELLSGERALSDLPETERLL